MLNLENKISKRIMELDDIRIEIEENINNINNGNHLNKRNLYKELNRIINIIEELTNLIKYSLVFPS